VAQVKTEHRKGEPSKTTCREICRYYINGKVGGFISAYSM
jgi:hypothetical protein